MQKSRSKEKPTKACNFSGMGKRVHTNRSKTNSLTLQQFNQNSNSVMVNLRANKPSP